MSRIWMSPSMKIPQCLWVPVPLFDHLQDNVFPPWILLKLPMSIGSCSIAVHLQEESSSVFSVSSKLVVADSQKVSRAFSLPGWTDAALSASPRRSCAPAPWPPWWPPVDWFQYIHVFVVLGSPKWLGTPDVVSHVVYRVGGSFPYTCWLHSY